MFTDIVGYTALMQESEAKAVLIRERHRNIFEKTTEAFEGQIIQYYGDGTLSIFSSAVMAVRCAVEMQRQFRQVPIVPLRIGIHMGDIIITETDIIGNSVNLASRVESLGVAGSILISEMVFEEIGNQEDIKVVDMGVFQFKNDAKERKIYAVDAPGVVVPKKHQLEGKTVPTSDRLNRRQEVSSRAFSQIFQKWPLMLGSVFVLLLAVMGIRYKQWQTKVLWAETEAIPQIEEWVEARNFRAAYTLSMEAEEYIPSDPKLNELMTAASMRINVTTDPPDVQVFRKDYTGTDSAWVFIGQTPLTDFRAYRGTSLWRFEKEGFEPVICMDRYALGRDTVRLFPKETIPEGMVYIPATSSGLFIPGIRDETPVSVPAFFMDRYEVTNEQYKVFVDSGGYEHPKYWQYPFIRKGRQISWAKAMADLKDRTDRFGPVNWEAGDFPKGKGQHPVSGISWHEAAAYANFVGKDLPSIYHFNAAVRGDENYLIIPESNFEDKGSAPVGTYEGIGLYGTFDLAGNVREWHANEVLADGQRFIMGGAWSDPLYMAYDGQAQLPFDRSAINGFRCVQYIDQSSKNDLEKPIDISKRDLNQLEPVSNEVFASYQNQFNYDPLPFNDTSVVMDATNEDYKLEKVRINAAYGEEQMDIYLYLPTGFDPPYQVVMYFPGSGVMHQPRYNPWWVSYIDFFAKSGRAIVLPVFKSTFDRKDGFTEGYPNESVAYKEHVIMWVKDFSRTLDFLETRTDLDTRQTAFFGWSWGGTMGGIIPAVEKRIKAVILTGGGLTVQKALPEVDQLNYLPRITQPFLLLNGKYDSAFPFELSQQPMMDLLGTPSEQKELVPFEASHMVPRYQLIKESLAWLDRHLGKPNNQ